MYSYGGYSSYNSDLDSFLELSAGLLIFVVILALTVGIFTLIGNIRILQKSGRSGWLAIVPIYSTYVLHKLADAVVPFILLMVFTGASTVISYFAPDYWWLSLCCFIGIFVVNIIYKHRLCVAFNKSGGFCFGLVVLEPIFMMILGCGSAEYVGPYPGSRLNPNPPVHPSGEFPFDSLPSYANEPTTDDFQTVDNPHVSPRQDFHNPIAMPSPNYPAPETDYNMPPRYLIGTKGVLNGRSIPLNGIVSIGTSSDNDIHLPSGTPGVSRKHCRIQYKKGVVAVLDDNSTYGTYINGRKLEPGRPMVLHRGSTLSLGSPEQSFSLKD